MSTPFQRYTKATIEPLNQTRVYHKGWLDRKRKVQTLYSITLTRPGCMPYSECWWCASDDEAEKEAVKVLAKQNARITEAEDRYNRIRVVEA